MTINFPLWRLYHFPCAASACLRVFVQKNITTSGVLVVMIQMNLHEDYDLSHQFSFDEFPLANSILISCKKGLVSHFILDPCSCFHYYVRRHLSFVFT